MESLASAAGLSIRHVRKKLQTLPTTLTGTYNEAMQRIENQEPDHKSIAFKTLAWISYAFRSLSLKELQHALAIEPGDTALDEELIMNGQSITSLCADLVIVDQRTNAVNLVHYTTKNYFEEFRDIYFPSFHASITLSCATYLTLPVLKDATTSKLVHHYPLACYAAQYMGDHARQTPEDALEPSVLEAICQLLSHPDKRKPLLSLIDGLDLIRSGFYSIGSAVSEAAANMTNDSADSGLQAMFGAALGLSEDELQLSSLEGPSGSGTEQASEDVTADAASTVTRGSSHTRVRSQDSEFSMSEATTWESTIKASRIPEVTALHLAASMGLAKVASMLLKETPNIDAVDETGKTALAVAMERGFEKAVEFLVTSGACVNLRHEHGRAVLLLVTERDWHNAGEIIAAKALAEVTEDPAAVVQDPLYLLLAAYHGDVEKARHLTKAVDFALTSQDSTIEEMALFLAVERGHSEVVQILLEAGVNVNAKDNVSQTPLHRATRRENEALIRLLLKYGAAVDCKDDDGRTPWSANARSLNAHILGILLEAGADPSTKGLQEVSELYTAAKNGETEFVGFMLKSGTDPSIKTIYN